MQKIRKITLLAIISLLLWSKVWAISEGGAIFLMIRPGARPSGMGSAFCAVADDATATYYNPAGLANLKRSSSLLEYSEVKDWGKLLKALNNGQGSSIFKEEDLLSAEGLVVTLSEQPILYRQEVVDWPGLVEAMQDSLNATSRMIVSTMPSEQKDLLFRMKPGEPIEDQVQDSLCWAFNRVINNTQLIGQMGGMAIHLPPQASEIIAKYRLAPDGKDFTPADIKDPKTLYRRLSEQSDNVSKSVFSFFPTAVKTQLKKRNVQQLPDSMRVLLAGGLNRALALGKIGSSSETSGGGESRLNNQAVILSAYQGLMDIRIDRFSAEENKRLNRVLLEIAARGKIRTWNERIQFTPLLTLLKTRLTAQLEQIMLQYNGETPMPEAEKRILLDGINELMVDEEITSYLNSSNFDLDQSTKQLVEGLSISNLALRNAILVAHHLPAYLSLDRVRQSPISRLKALSGPQFNAQLAKHDKGQPLDAQGRQEVLDGINRALSNSQLYQNENWREVVLPGEIRELLSQGVNNISKEELYRLNRLLLEKMLTGEIEPLGREKRYTTLMHSPWFSEIWADVGDMYYEYIAYAQPVKDWGVFGFNVIFISEGTSERTSVTGEYQGQFSSFELSPCLSYGNQIFEDLAGGVNLKLIHSHLAPFGAEGSQGKGVATSWALDFGVLYHGPFRGLSFGANLQNIGPKLTYIDADEADPLSRNIRTGLAYKILNGRLAKMTAAYDLTKMLVVTDRSWKEELKEAVHHMGLEYLYTGLATLGLRSGYVIDEVGQIKGPTFGLGVGYKSIQFDFGMEPGGELQKYNKKYSLSVEL